MVKNNMEKDLRVLSLFSGCGGMDLGFEGGFSVLRDSVAPCPELIAKGQEGDFVQLQPTRFRMVFANDILGEAQRTWQRNFSKRGVDPEAFHLGSIVDLVNAAKRGEFSFPERIDVVTGGFPCQDFSTAGKRRGFASHRNHKGEIVQDGAIPTVETRGMLYYWLKEVIELVQPKVFFAENVKGLTNLEDAKEIIQRDFSQAANGGYIVLPARVLQAADYGVPQSRERVIFIGLRRSALTEEALCALERVEIPQAYDPYPVQTHAKEGTATLAPWVTVGKLFAHLREPEETEDVSQRYYSGARFLSGGSQGQKEVDLAGIAPAIRAEHHGNIEFRRLSAENGGTHAEELRKGMGQRRLTPRECALIQTFPPDWDAVVLLEHSTRFAISPSAAYKVIGNAVPPLLGYRLAKRIEELWDRMFKKS